MNSAERSDVDISKLLTWRKEFDLLDDNSDVITKVYIRLVGDAELNRARVYAIRKSAEMRKKLKDHSSDEYFAYVPDIETVDVEEIIETTILYSIQDFTSEASKKLDIKEPKELHSEATLEEQEKYQKEVDEYPDKREKEIREFIDKQIENKRKELSKKSKEELYKNVIQLIIEYYCRTAMIDSFRLMCTYFGTYSDSNYKIRFFESVDELDNAPSHIKTQVKDFYSSLDLGLDDLKN
jgi:hypothetical protein